MLAMTEFKRKKNVCGREMMTSTFPAPAVCARHEAQTTSWNTHNTHEAGTEEETEGQGGEVMV